MTTSGYVFVGPTGGVEVLHGRDDVVLLSPARRGDVLALLDGQPSFLALIDGMFGQAPSVLHKELLLALDRGIPVYGAASMGALRAAELGPYGMIGVGEIHARYASAELTGDDEVAIAHAEADLSFKPLSFPLVELRFTLVRAVEDGDIEPEDARRILSAARALHFRERTFGALAEALPGFAIQLATLRQRWVPQKRLDAQALAARIVAEVPSPRPARCTVGATRLLAFHQLGHRRLAPEAPSDRDLLAVARLLVEDLPRLQAEVCLEVLLAQIADELGLSEGALPAGPSNAWVDVRRRAGRLRAWWAQLRPMEGDAALASRAVGLRLATWEPASRELLLGAAPAPHQRIAELRTPEGGLPDVLIAEALRASPLATEAMERAAAVARANERQASRSPGFAARLLGDRWVLEDFVAHGGWTSLSLEEHGRARGFADLASFVDALKLTWAWRASARRSRP